ncbi:MAG: general secretion pathway protein M [Enterobacterales bacterium]|jgi:general secretion pathway protein M
MSSFTDLMNKYHALESREKQILNSGIVVVSIFIIYVLIFKPMNDSITRLEKSNASNQQLLEWMTQSVASIKGSTSSKNVNKRNGRSLNVIINTTASSARISISRSQPRDNNQYQIWLDKAMFKDLLLWLNVLQKDYGIFVSTINLGVTEVQGQVRVNLTFQDSGS